MTRLSSSLPACTLSFRWKTQSTLCLCCSLKERERPIRPWTRNKKHSVEVPDACPRDIFPNMNSLLRALLTLPMITCTVERLFPAVNRMKTGTRATMLTDRLNSLTQLSFERELTDSLEYQVNVLCSAWNPAFSCCYKPQVPQASLNWIVCMCDYWSVISGCLYC